MAVLLQTSQGDMVVDLLTDLAPTACKNFLKLCKCVLSCSVPVNFAPGKAGGLKAVD